LLAHYLACLGDLFVLGAASADSASFASRAARSRAVFARTATLFASISRIACAASLARCSLIAAAELGCSEVFEVTGIGASPRHEGDQEIPVSGPLGKQSLDEKARD